MKMNLENLYNEIQIYIDKVNFSKLWKGFEKLKFALYTNDECYFDGKYIEKTDQFIANTAIKYNNEMIAIWYVNEEIDPIILTSKIIHEMFHGFQYLNNETRFIDEFEALYNYKYNDYNLSIKLKENKLINDLLEQFSYNKYNELLKLRKYRCNHYNYEYHYESSIEQIEGTANFVEINVLKQLSNSLYLNKLNQMQAEILKKDNLIPIRAVSYDIGALLLTILKGNNIMIDESFTSIPFSESIIKNTIEEEISIELIMTKEINDYNLKTEKTIYNTINNNNIIVDELCELVGVNFYNAVYYKNYIISKYFVMYDDKILYGDFLIETKEYKKITKIYKI